MGGGGMVGESGPPGNVVGLLGLLLGGDLILGADWEKDSGGNSREFPVWLLETKQHGQLLGL